MAFKIESTQTAEQQEKMYGETIQSFVEAYTHGCDRRMEDLVEMTMYATCILSDAQETMARGNTEQARQWINKAKWFISESRKIIRLNERKGA